MTLYLSRIRLARSPSVQALSPLLTGPDAASRRSADHNLLWSVFSDGPERQRDFLWRSESDGSYLTLSARPPRQLDLFEPHETKEFAPVLSSGDVLAFSLRANATRTKRDGGRVDVVMDALHALPSGARAEARMDAAQREGTAWLERQGDAAGFRVVSANVEDYSTERISARRRKHEGTLIFGILDLAGRIEVTDSAAFVERLARGFGRAKAFGCGLMLIRRVK